MRFPWTNPIVWTAGALTLFAYGWRLPLLAVRGFDPDEFEHLHGAWRVSLGELPYRDFFEHHTPLLHFFLAPFFAFFDVSGRADDGIAFLFFARRWMWIFSGIILILTFETARRWRGVPVGVAAAFFLSHALIFLEKTLEVRPDLFSTMFWLGCLLLMMTGIRADGASPRRQAAAFAGSGACLALGILSTQKLLFAGPGFALTALWFLFDPRGRVPIRRRFWLLILQAVGFLIPIAGALGYFAARDGLEPFLHFNLFLNLQWKSRFSPKGYLTQWARQNPAMVAFAALGLAWVGRRLLHGESVRRADFVIPVNAVGLFAGLFLMPVPYRQYYQTFLPLAAILAAVFLVEGTRGLFAFRRGETPVSDAQTGGFFLILTAAAVVHALRFAAPSMRELVPWIPLAAGIAGAIALAGAWRRAPEWTTAAAIGFCAIYPLAQMKKAFEWTCDGQLRELRAVYERSAPTETVMDGWTGNGVFRPHAYFYWFLHGEVRAMLTDEDRRQVLAALESGAMAPRLIAFDGNLRDFSPETARFFEERYEPIGVGTLRQRKP